MWLFFGRVLLLLDGLFLRVGRFLRQGLGDNLEFWIRVPIKEEKRGTGMRVSVGSGDRGEERVGGRKLSVLDFVVARDIAVGDGIRGGALGGDKCSLLQILEHISGGSTACCELRVASAIGIITLRGE